MPHMLSEIRRALRWQGLSFLVLFTFAVALLAMDEFTSAKVFFWLSAIVLWVRIFGAAWKRRTQMIVLLFVAAIVGVGFFQLWMLYWVDIRRTASMSVRKGTFVVDLRHVMFASSSESAMPVWVTHPDETGTVRSPISVMAHIELTNLQASAAVINRFTVEAQTESGAWIRLARINSSSVLIFWVVNGDFTAARLIKPRPAMLDELIEGRAMSPKETVSGWILLVYPGISPPVRFTTNYRITVGDTTGTSLVQETKGSESDVGTAGWFLGGSYDISRYPVALYQNNPNYWSR